MSGIAHTQNIVVASKETTHTENAEDENDESTQINRVTNILPKRNDLSILSHSSSVYTPSSDDKLSNIHEKIKDIVNKDSSSNIKELDSPLVNLSEILMEKNINYLNMYFKTDNKKENFVFEMIKRNALNPKAIYAEDNTNQIGNSSIDTNRIKKVNSKMNSIIKSYDSTTSKTSDSYNSLHKSSVKVGCFAKFCSK